jgi:two-component system response regulator FlrC
LDVVPLARRAINACARAGQVLSLSSEAELKLSRHSWPGNARELTNIVQRAAWLANGGTINAEDLDIGAAAAASATPPLASPTLPTVQVPQPFSEAGLDEDLKERERELILATLRITGGSRKLTAERLGISPRTLRHKLQQLKAAGINVPRVFDQHYLTA